jgi:RsmE family RNA methyltransferase
VNIVLFEAEEVGQPLPRGDARARHVLDVLRRRVGETFDAGLIDGARGKATVVEIREDALELSFEWGETPPLPEHVVLILGMPRPQTARKVLEEATALGVGAMHFVRTERGEPGYATSRLWTTGEWRRHVIDGAQQAFSTRMPDVTFEHDLAGVLGLELKHGTRLALDNYESAERLGEVEVALPVELAVGPERGWSPREREMLREAGFRFVHLGERVLRVETAVVAALALVRARLGLM